MSPAQFARKGARAEKHREIPKGNAILVKIWSAEADNFSLLSTYYKL